MLSISQPLAALTISTVIDKVPVNLSIAFIVLVVFASIFRSLLRAPQKPPKRPLRIIILGYKESGKTVFLASMFHKLSTANEVGFRLQTNVSLQRNLEKIYRTVEHPQSKLPISFSPKLSVPTGLGEIQKYEFIGHVCGPKERGYQVINFVYYDYAGEVFTDIVDGKFSSRSEGLKQDMLEADLGLAVLDGSKLLGLMKTGRHVEFEQELRKMLNFISDASIPIHFLITKWDLFAARRITLATVIHELEKIEAFGNFLTNYSRGNVLRIIPVSAVGTGYIKTLGKLTFRTRKRKPQPINVDVPIACLLPDVLESVFARSQTESSQNKNVGRRFNRRIRYLEWVTLAVSLQPIPVSVTLHPATVAGSNGDSSAAAEANGSLVINHRTALRRLYLYFQDRIRNFDEEFPGNKIFYMPYTAGGDRAEK